MVKVGSDSIPMSSFSKIHCVHLVTWTGNVVPLLWFLTEVASWASLLSSFVKHVINIFCLCILRHSNGLNQNSVCALFNLFFWWINYRNKQTDWQSYLFLSRGHYFAFGNYWWTRCFMVFNMSMARQFPCFSLHHSVWPLFSACRSSNYSAGIQKEISHKSNRFCCLFKEMVPLGVWMQWAECIELLRTGKLWGLMAGLSGVTACKWSQWSVRQQHFLFSETRSSAWSLDHKNHKLSN